MSTEIETAGVQKYSTVGQLVAAQPARANIFDEFGIDYCCGGKLTLEEACRRKGVRLNELLERLENNTPVSPQEKDWSQQSLKELMNHIVFHYHRPLQHQLPRVLQLAQKVADAHGKNHPEILQVFHLLKEFSSQLELHMHKEEMILFPAINALEEGNVLVNVGCGGSIEMPIAVMTQEHDEAGAALDNFTKLTNNFTPPDDACNSFRVLLHALATIKTDMKAHVHKENSILFPGAMRLLQKSAG